MSESTSIILTDYQQLYQEARMHFLSSNDWERKRNSFLREQHQKVVVGDNEELKRYLRNKREDELNEFIGKLSKVMSASSAYAEDVKESFIKICDPIFASDEEIEKYCKENLIAF